MSLELGHTISIDACHWKRNRDGREAIIVNIIDEASRFIDGAARGIEVQVAAGEAHWQIGNVETHIRLLRNQPSLMEDGLPDASIDELVEHCVAAKVRRQTFDGYSPLQWWFGLQCAREVEERGLGEIDREQQSQFLFAVSCNDGLVLGDQPDVVEMASCRFGDGCWRPLCPYGHSGPRRAARWAVCGAPWPRSRSRSSMLLRHVRPDRGGRLSVRFSPRTRFKSV